MIIINRVLRSFAVFFHKNNETKPLPKARQTLADFLKRKVSKNDFQESFSAYQAYLIQILEDNPDYSKTKVNIFDLATKIHATYQLQSKKLNKIHNRMADECLQYAQKQSLSQLIKVLGMLQRVNKGKALAIFKKQQQKIMDQMRNFEADEVIQLLNFTWKINYKVPMIRETAIQVLYPNLQHLKIYHLKILLQCLAHSKKYINKQFIQKLASRVLTLYKCNNIEDRELPIILATLSEIQKNLHTRSIYLQELDELYERAFPQQFSNVQTLPDGQFNLLVSAVRRSKHFDEVILIKIAEIALSRQIKEFSELDSSSSSLKTISLRTFLNILHTHAVYNYHHTQLKSYALKLLTMLKTQQELINSTLFFNLLWSLCVLYTRHQLASLYPLIEKYIVNVKDVEIAQAYNIYYSYLYLRSVCPQFSEHRAHIHSLMSKYNLETHTSNTQKQVYQTFLSLGVPCIPEYNLNNLVCDILIPEWNTIRNVIVEVHGFRHFCRNVKRATGSNKLKEKIIAAEMYKYYYITIDQWFIAEDKKAFLVEFLEHLEQLQRQANQQQKILDQRDSAPQTVKIIKGRPRKFRSTSRKLLLD